MKPRGPVTKLQLYQNQSLRIVAGAYKATPIRLLETEAFTPPLDLWLNGRIACFQARLERTGIAQQTREACGAIQERLRRRGRRQNGLPPPPPPPTPGQNRKAWLEAWVGGPIDRWNEPEKPKALQDWKKRWEAHNRRICRQEPSGASQGRDRYVPEDAEPTTRVLALHKHLVLVQARTGKIGFAKFLCDRRVPGYATGQCLCGHGLEAPRHIALYCQREQERRHLLRIGGLIDYRLLTGSPQGARTLSEWIIRSGRLNQYSLERCLLYD
jgi:hypothetical protein